MKTCAYCNIHPGCQLLQNYSLNANQETGDANPIHGWICSSQGCARMWGPEFGYITQRLGEKLVYDGSGPRCPTHGFMVVGDSVATRRYVCPVADCNEVGPIVDTPPGDCGPVKQNDPPESKAAREMRIFRQFAKASGLRIEEAVNCIKPYPDIGYTAAAGGRRYMELGEITDEALAKYRAQFLEGKIGPGFTYSHDRPFRKMIQDKALKPYETDGNEIDLLLYFEKQLPSEDNLTRCLKEYATEVSTLTARFSVVFIFNTWKGVVLWKSSA